MKGKKAPPKGEVTEKKANKDSSSFLKKLKATCKHCTDNTVKVYFRAAKRLYKLVSDGPIPATGGWLEKKELKTKYKKLPLAQRRALSIAAVKAAQALKVKKATLDSWTVSMLGDANAYDVLRSKNKKTDKEKAAWPKGGYKDVKKASKEMWKRVKVLLKDEPSMKTLYRYQMFIALKLFTEIAWRNTFATLSLDTKQPNHIIQPRKGNMKIHLSQHKTSKKTGSRTVDLSRAASMAIRKFLKYREQVVDNKYFFNSMKKEKMSRATLGKALHRVTKELIGKAFGSRIIRLLAATDSADIIESATKLTESKMLHGLKTAKQYIRKD